MEEILACRVCLATNVKLFNMYKYRLVTPYENLTGIEFSKEAGPFHHMCSYCSSLLIKCEEFYQKCTNTIEFFDNIILLEPEESYQRLIERKAEKLKLPYCVTDNVVIDCVGETIKMENEEDPLDNERNYVSVQPSTSMVELVIKEEVETNSENENKDSDEDDDITVPELKEYLKIKTSKLVRSNSKKGAMNKDGKSSVKVSGKDMVDKINTNKKQYECNYCNETFSQSNQYNDHMNTAHYKPIDPNKRKRKVVKEIVCEEKDGAGKESKAKSEGIHGIDEEAKIVSKVKDGDGNKRKKVVGLEDYNG